MSATGRSPKMALDAERAVLGAMLLGPDPVARAASALKPSHFYFRAHAKTFEAALALHARGTPVDLVTLAGELEARDELAQTGGPAKLATLSEAAFTAANLEHHARLVRLAYAARERARIGQALLDGVSTDPAAARGLLERLEAVEREAEGEPASPTVSLSQAAHAFTRLDHEHLRVPEPLLGDGLICRSDLALLSGRPRLGKSRIAIELAVACARGELWLGLNTHEPARVGYVAAEFTSYRFLERCVQLFRGEPYSNDNPASLVASYLGLGFSASGGLMLPIPSDLPSETLNLLTEAGAVALEQFITDFALNLCVLDPLGRLMGGQDETNEFFGKVVATLDRVRFRTGCAILVVHHERKESKDQRGNPDPLDAIRGGTKLTDFANTVIRVSQGPGTLKVVSFPKANFAVTPDDIYLSIPRDGGRSVLEKSPGQKSDENRERIASWAASQGRPFTTEQAAKAVGMTKKPVRSHLEKLAESGTLKASAGPNHVTLWSSCGEGGERWGVDPDSPLERAVSQRFDLES